MQNLLNWSQFEMLNENTTDSFENLCRNLFKRQFFDEYIIFRSDPNHAGTEIDPIYSEKVKSRISFQAKFFSRNDYSQIKKSTDNVIKVYKDELDTLYLYCNRDLDINSSGFKSIRKSLNETGIEIELITNKEILDQVLLHEDLQSYFFKKNNLNREWFKGELKKSLNNLGPRYNPTLNGETEAEKLLNLFIKDREAIDLINNKKKLLEENLLRLKRDIDKK